MDIQIRTIIKVLLDKTIAGNANWSRVTNSETYFLILENGRVLIEKLVLKSGGQGIQFTILNKKNDVVHSTLAKRLDTPSIVVKSDDNFDILNDLYESVRKALFKTDETIRGIIIEIEKPGDIGLK
jgi:hypothetical protein